MKNIFKKIAAFALSSAMIIPTLAACSQQEKPELLDFTAFTPHLNEEYVVLEKSPDEDFVILNLSDTQMDHHDWRDGNVDSDVLKYTVNELIEKVQPDLITVSGDLTESTNQFTAYRKLANLLESYDIPWAPVWGNHDYDETIEDLLYVEIILAGYENCLYKSGEPELGYGNYILSIEENGKPITSIFMMDSHNKYMYIDDNGREQEGGYAKLYPQQIEWYAKHIEDQISLGYKDSMTIQHIPLYVYIEAFDAAFNSEYDHFALTIEDSFDDKYWNEGYEDSFGVRHIAGGFPYENEGAFEVIKELGLTKYVLAGHNHTNNYNINYQGVNLACALKTGVGSYWEKELNGGTVIKISSEGISDFYYEYVNIDHILEAHGVLN